MKFKNKKYFFISIFVVSIGLFWKFQNIDAAQKNDTCFSNVPGGVGAVICPGDEDFKTVNGERAWKLVENLNGCTEERGCEVYYDADIINTYSSSTPSIKELCLNACGSNQRIYSATNTKWFGGSDSTKFCGSGFWVDKSFNYSEINNLSSFPKIGSFKKWRCPNEKGGCICGAFRCNEKVEVENNISVSSPIIFSEIPNGCINSWLSDDKLSNNTDANGSVFSEKLIDADYKSSSSIDKINLCGLAGLNTESAPKFYSWSASDFSGDFCLYGNPVEGEIKFPDMGVRQIWTCNDQSGNNSQKCYAFRGNNDIPVYTVSSSEQNNTETETEIEAESENKNNDSKEKSDSQDEPSCGTARKIYNADQTSFGDDTLCINSVVDSGETLFPEEGRISEWRCSKTGNWLADVFLPEQVVYCAAGRNSLDQNNVACGDASGAYLSNAQNFRSENFCGNGYNLSSAKPIFPASLGQLVNWVCEPNLIASVFSDNAEMVVCSASREWGGTVIFGKSCNEICEKNSECETDYCYQLPMPECGEGEGCLDVMPQKVCRSKWCPTVDNCNAECYVNYPEPNCAQEGENVYYSGEVSNSNLGNPSECCEGLEIEYCAGVCPISVKGKCVKKTNDDCAKLGEMCGGIAGIKCCSSSGPNQLELGCHITNNHPDATGFCDGVTHVNNTSNSCSESVNYEGKNYPVVQIGSQCWLAANLNVGVMIKGGNQTNNSVIEKYCYDNNEINCNALYQWREAMQYSTTPGAQGICPDGWHIPTDGEMYALESHFNSSSESCNPNRDDNIIGSRGECDPAGTALKAGGLSGFNGSLSGVSSSGTAFGSFGVQMSFWSSTPYNALPQGNISFADNTAWYRTLVNQRSTVSRNHGRESDAFAVRCIKDNFISSN